MQFWQLLSVLIAKRWVWKAAIAGLCGNITHTLLMLGKAKLGILELFQPYQSLQIALSYSTGENIHPLMPWLLSYINGSLWRALPSPIFIIVCRATAVPLRDSSPEYSDGWRWILIFFPLLGLGPFAMHLGLGIWPALFSLGNDAGLQHRDGPCLRHDGCEIRFSRCAPRHLSPSRISSECSPLLTVNPKWRETVYKAWLMQKSEEIEFQC